MGYLRPYKKCVTLHIRNKLHQHKNHRVFRVHIKNGKTEHKINDKSVMYVENMFHVYIISYLS